MDTNMKITSREKGLQILYWLEDKGVDANFSQWNENSYYFNFNDERDYNNALILLYEYCGKDSIRYDDYSRMEIEVDVDKAYPRLVDNVNSKYMGKDWKESLNEDAKDNFDDDDMQNLFNTLADDNNIIDNRWIKGISKEQFESIRPGDFIFMTYPYDNVKKGNKVTFEPHFVFVLNKSANDVYGFNISSQTKVGFLERSFYIPLNDWRQEGFYKPSSIVLTMQRNSKPEHIFRKASDDTVVNGHITRNDLRKLVSAFHDLNNVRNYKLNYNLSNTLDRVHLITESNGVRVESKEVSINSIYESLKNLLEAEENDSVTEQLLEDDKVEDDLEDIIRDTIEENKNSGSKINLFEITTEPENPTREKDEEKMYVVDFDDMKTDFRKLTIYPYEKTEDGANKPVASFMLSGGLNGSGNWTDYLDDLQNLFEKLKEATGLEPLVYEESTDIADDVWDAKVFMYDHNKDEEESNEEGQVETVEEGLFNPEVEDKSYIRKDKDGKYSLHSWTQWTKNIGFHVFDGAYDSLDELYSCKPWARGLEVRDGIDENLNDELDEEESNEEGQVETVEEGLFNAPLSYVFNVGDTFTTPIDFEDEAFVADTMYEIVELDDGKYGLYYENLDHPNVSGGSGYVEDFEADTLEKLSEMIFEYDSHISKEMINRWGPYDSYYYGDSDGEEDSIAMASEFDRKNENLDETYSKDELDSFKNKVFNQQKVMSIYKKKKYGKKRLMCRVKCTNCGRQKKLFLSNLVTNPEKYGSCICSDKNINARYDTINGLYKGTKKLRNNTSGYTGVSWVAKYGGEPYNKWRAYIDIDGQRNYLGDFSSKSKAIRARKAAAAKGIKWYAENKDQFMATSRRNRKRKRKLKNKKSTTA